jgi:hypothetical protein
VNGRGHVFRHSIFIHSILSTHSSTCTSTWYACQINTAWWCQGRRHVWQREVPNVSRHACIAACQLAAELVVNIQSSPPQRNRNTQSGQGIGRAHTCSSLRQDDSPGQCFRAETEREVRLLCGAPGAHARPLQREPEQRPDPSGTRHRRGRPCRRACACRHRRARPVSATQGATRALQHAHGARAARRQTPGDRGGVARCRRAHSKPWTLTTDCRAPLTGPRLRNRARLTASRRLPREALRDAANHRFVGLRTCG